MATSQFLTSGDLLPSPANKIIPQETLAGYAQTVFEGKAEQMLRVSAHIKEKGFIPHELIENEVAWFYG